ncbi:MAG: cell division protein FtsA [Acidobacteria bacterium]|nr:cell division protein FtsA [Acidobacteriota bacterium]
MLSRLHALVTGERRAPRKAAAAELLRERWLAGKARPAVGLDVGRSRVRCAVCVLDGEYMCFLGCGDAESKGWSRSRIHDPAAITESVRAAIQDAERAAGVPVSAAVVGVGGLAVEGQNMRGVYEFGRPREVVAEDLSYAVELASRVRLEEDRYLLQVLPQDFTIDGRAGFRNPCGAAISRLEANVHVVTTSLREHEALVHAVQQAHIEVQDTVFEPIAAAYAAILPEERERGVALADIGAHSTGVAIYDGDALVRAASIPIGGDHFTRDVAQCLPALYDDARQLKEEFGCALLGLTGDSILIHVPSPEGRPPRAVSRRFLNEILDARAQELFHFVRQEIVASGMDRDLLEGVVLTGGGAILSGICDAADKVLDCQTRNGLPVGIEGWPEEIDDPAWATVAGLAMWSGRLKYRQSPGRKAPDLLKLILR